MGHDYGENNLKAKLENTKLEVRQFLVYGGWIIGHCLNSDLSQCNTVTIPTKLQYRPNIV